MQKYEGVLSIRLTREEREALDLMAKFESTSRGAILRRYLCEAIRSQLPVILATTSPNNSISKAV